MRRVRPALRAGAVPAAWSRRRRRWTARPSAPPRLFGAADAVPRSRGRGACSRSSPTSPATGTGPREALGDGAFDGGRPARIGAWTSTAWSRWRRRCRPTGQVSAAASDRSTAVLTTITTSPATVELRPGRRTAPAPHPCSRAPRHRRGCTSQGDVGVGRLQRAVSVDRDAQGHRVRRGRRLGRHGELDRPSLRAVVRRLGDGDGAVRRATGQRELGELRVARTRRRLGARREWRAAAGREGRAAAAGYDGGGVPLLQDAERAGLHPTVPGPAWPSVRE